MYNAAQSMIRAFEAGRSERQADEDRARAAEDRKIEQQLLQHRLRAIKLEDQINAWKLNRQGAADQFAAVNGLPEAQMPAGALDGMPARDLSSVTAGPMGAVSDQVPVEANQPLNVRPMTMPGLSIPDAGIDVPAVQQQPQTMEQLLSQRVAEARIKALGNVRPEVPREVSWSEHGKNVTQWMTPSEAARRGRMAAPLPASQTGGGSGTGAPASAPIEPGKRWYKTAQDLAYGRLTFSQFRTLVAYGRDPNLKGAIYEKATELNPNFNPASFEMGFKFASSPQTQRALAAVDNVMPNIDSIIALSNSWDRSKYPDINRFVAAAKFKMGNTTIANLRQAQKLIGDELGVALGAGTMTDMKLKLGLDVVDPNLSPEAFVSSMERVKEFLYNRKQSLLNQMGPYGAEGVNPGADTPGYTPKMTPAHGATAPKKVGRFEVVEVK